MAPEETTLRRWGLAGRAIASRVQDCRIRLVWYDALGLRHLVGGTFGISCLKGSCLPAPSIRRCRGGLTSAILPATRSSRFE